MRKQIRKHVHFHWFVSILDVQFCRYKWERPYTRRRYVRDDFWNWFFHLQWAYGIWNSWIAERMQCKRSLQWLKTWIWSSLFQLFFYNSNIKSTIRIVIQHPLIYEPITDEFVIRWGRSSRFFHASGCKLHNIVFHHGSLLPLEIHGNLNWTDDNSLSKNNPKALSLTGFPEYIYGFRDCLT